MKTIAFSIPIYKYQVQNWEVKKKKLLDLFNSFETRTVNNVITSPMINNTNIFLDEINYLEKETNLKFLLSEIWFQKYQKNMNHGIHIHGPHGFSSVCFIKYDKNHHNPTKFISPFPSHIHGNIEGYEPEVEEGDIIFFPSNLMHHSQTNTSDKERIVVSMNLNIDFSKKTNNSFYR